ncbi:MAG TPA: hypothetical protein VGG13_02260 [Candidatus Saccharimonadales bacterium]
MTGTKITIKEVDKRQAGAAAILITMVTMIVVSLIVIGFAMISRREQSNTLDQQLSTQAFYAAESGVNDARSVILADLNTPAGIPPKTSCTTDVTTGAYNENYPVPPANKNGVSLDSAHNVSYTCLLVDPAVTTLQYNDVGDQSKVVPITASATIHKIQITWSPATNPDSNLSSCPGSTNQTFSPATATGWTCGYGVLRMDAVPTNGTLTGGVGAGSLESKTLTAFFEPQKSGGGAGLPYSQKGQANVAAATSCAANANRKITQKTKCTATVTGLASANSKSFSLRLNSLYSQSNVTIQVYGQGGNALTITGAQATVDVTGNANGVLRRILVHLPLTTSSNLIPDDAIETNGALCKRFEVAPNYFSIPGDIEDADPNNVMCQQQ